MALVLYSMHATICYSISQHIFSMLSLNNLFLYYYYTFIMLLKIIMTFTPSVTKTSVDYTLLFVSKTSDDYTLFL